MVQPGAPALVRPAPRNSAETTDTTLTRRRHHE